MSETPSDRARELLRGAFDTHMHISPDVVERITDDISLARKFQELGMAGFVLKSHYGSTAERAAVVRAAVPGVQVLGAIALNRAVGGINPLAVEIAAREGARTVWLPTVDSVNESHEREAPRRSQGARLGQAPAGSARAGHRDPAGAGRRRPRLAPARGIRGPRDGRAAQDVPGHGPSRPGRDLHGRGRRRRFGCRDDRDHPPRVPVAGPVGRRSERAGGQGRPARALLHDPAHGQGHLGAVDSRTFAPPDPSARCCRPISGRCSIRPSRTGCP